MRPDQQRWQALLRSHEMLLLRRRHQRLHLLLVLCQHTHLLLIRCLRLLRRQRRPSRCLRLLRWRRRHRRRRWWLLTRCLRLSRCRWWRRRELLIIPCLICWRQQQRQWRLLIG